VLSLQEEIEMKETLSQQAYLKSPYKSIKHSTYFEVYDDLFPRYRGKKVTFVEIGVLGGRLAFYVVGVSGTTGQNYWR
tara:strand:- start:3436 stop:3669 length:234 start_codon:yes stop_codon:yes gene_type:complete